MFPSNLSTLLFLLALAVLLPTVLADDGSLLETCDFHSYLPDNTLRFCCDNPYYRDHHNSPRGWWRTMNSINLDNFLMNSDGNLIWRDDGKFSYVCKDCTIKEWPEYMTCLCTAHDGGGKWTQTDPWLYVLDRRFKNKSGYLLCNNNSAYDASVEPINSCDWDD